MEEIQAYGKNKREGLGVKLKGRYLTSSAEITRAREKERERTDEKIEEKPGEGDSQGKGWK